jgi:hypothetical protein
MKTIQLFLLWVLAAILLSTPKPPTVLVGKNVFLSYGRMRPSKDMPYHVIIGYDAENVSIETPPDTNVIANSNFTVKGCCFAGPVIQVGSPLAVSGVNATVPKD